MLSRQQELAIIEQVRDVAKQEILPRFRCLPSEEISIKSSFDDLVTIADLATEKELIKRFQALLPDANILGEEAVSDNPSLLDSLSSSGLSIIIDPIDGTWNFANGLATFGVLIAAVFEGKTVFALLYDPVLDDWIEASLGKGCWYGKPNQAPRQITLSDKEEEPRLVGVMSPFLFQKTYQEPVALLQVSYARTNSLRCCCHEYRSLVQGSYDFFVSPKPKVWDHAAGILAYQEAGGFVKMLTGEDYQASVRTGIIIAARTESILARITNDFKAILI